MCTPVSLPHCFNYRGLIQIQIFSRVYFHSLLFPPPQDFSRWYCIFFYMNFRINLSNVRGENLFNCNHINFIYYLEENDHLYDVILSCLRTRMPFCLFKTTFMSYINTFMYFNSFLVHFCTFLVFIQVFYLLSLLKMRYSLQLLLLTGGLNM